jgi:hypothetical protein
MFITVHATAGIIIGKHIDNPFFAFALAFIAHFILDIIPHGDQKLGKRFFGIRFGGNELTEAEKSLKAIALYGLIDAFGLIFLILYLFRNFPILDSDSVTWGIIGSILPDLIVGLYVLGKFKILKPFYEFHTWNHHLLLNKMKSDIPLKIGMIFQACILALAVFTIFFW